jgi:hypothetical protein
MTKHEESEPKETDMGTVIAKMIRLLQPLSQEARVIVLRTMMAIYGEPAK